jgi:hypothetical protein
MLCAKMRLRFGDRLAEPSQIHSYLARGESVIKWQNPNPNALKDTYDYSCH